MRSALICQWVGIVSEINILGADGLRELMLKPFEKRLHYVKDSQQAHLSADRYFLQLFAKSISIFPYPSRKPTGARVMWFSWWDQAACTNIISAVDRFPWCGKMLAWIHVFVFCCWVFTNFTHKMPISLLTREYM